MPARPIVATGISATLVTVAADLALNRTLTTLFDLLFVVLCVSLALLVRPQDFFTVGMLPPLLMLGAFWLLAVVSPGVLADDGDGTVQALITGLAHHADALAVGYLLSLTCLAVRQRVLALRQASNRSGSPAPRRSTVDTPSE